MTIIVNSATIKSRKDLSGYYDHDQCHLLLKSWNLPLEKNEKDGKTYLMRH